jgi:hypothetical protein
MIGDISQLNALVFAYISLSRSVCLCRVIYEHAQYRHRMLSIANAVNIGSMGSMGSVGNGLMLLASTDSIAALDSSDAL